MDRRRAAAALLALAACIACSAAAPTATNHTALDLHDGSVEGCYYNFQHYGEGDRIMTNEPCLNCTCHNRMLMCYLRVCPFTKAIGQDCTVEKRADQCCPIVTCPDVPVDLLTSTSTSSPAEYGATGLGKLDKYGCSIHGKYFPEGSKVPPMPNKPCEHCYCIRNMTTCVMQECTLHVDGCTPIYHKDVCCPVRYSCDHPEDGIPLLDDMTTTVRPTPGFLLTTTTMLPVTQISQDCVHDDQIFPDGALIKTEKACEHCYCMKGDIVCVVQECGTPMENEGKNCTSLPPRHGQCCPDTYICEGDERVTDSTTEILELTSSPPRRVGVEGSGYRNEPDEPYTEISQITTETEGSGEDIATIPQTDTGDDDNPEKVTPEIIDETILTTTERSQQLDHSTEADKGQNTIPDSGIEKVTGQEPIPDKVTLSSFDESQPTITEEITTVVFTSQKDKITTTESVFTVDDESVSDESVTPKEHEKATTDSTDVISKTTFTDENIVHTYPSTIVPDQKAITTPTTEYSIKVEEPTKQIEISPEILVQPSVTEKNKFTDVINTSTEAEILIETTTNPVTNIIITESTSVDPNINEVDENVSPISSPSRIPGEGDCLLNGITYNNNTNVPSSNNCHTGCKCISSIIKCDPIICSPPPEYMENMNDCQPVYDTPNSCCPTYVCSVKETIPPESHSHMSGTESPKPITASECSGNDCITGEEKTPSIEPTICTSGKCLSDTPAIPKECESDDCKDQTETSSSVPSQDCSDGKCQILPVGSCEGDDCKTPTLIDTTSEKDLDSLNHPIQEDCESSDCKDQIKTTPSKLPDGCSDDSCQVSPTVPCLGENCKTDSPKDTSLESDLESTKIPAIQEECESGDCKNLVQTSQTIPPQDCSDGKCQVLPVVPCEGKNCDTNTLEGTMETDLASTKSPVTQEECDSNDCKDQSQTSPSMPSQECPDGKCQVSPVVPCEGENCEIEPLKDRISEKDAEPTKTPSLEHECKSKDCEGQVDSGSLEPSSDCTDEKCHVLPATSCEGENCKTIPPEKTLQEKDEPNVHDVQSSLPICNKEDGCEENNIIRQDECVDENCKQKDYEGDEGKVPSKCSGPDCKLYDEPTVQITDHATEVATEESTVTDINLQKTESIDYHVTTTKEKLTESDLYVTRQPTYTESDEKLTTTFEQIVTDSPKQTENVKEILQTDIPMIQTATETSAEVATETLQTEYTKLPVAVTTESQDKYGHTDEQLTSEINLSHTKPPEYLEIETEESFTKENEYVSTNKPQIYTDSVASVVAEEHTKLPHITVIEEHTKLPHIADTELGITLTESPELLVTEKDKIETESPEVTEKEKIETNPPETLGIENDKDHSETTEASFTVMEATQTTLPKVIITETDKIPFEVPAPEIVTEKELLETEVPEVAVTEKVVQYTGVTEINTVQEAVQTKAPETYITEKEAIETETLRVTAIDKETSQTENPEIIDDVKATKLTESPQVDDTGKHTIQTIPPELALTTKIDTEPEEPVTGVIQTKAPEFTVTQNEDVHTGIIELSTEKGSTSDQHEIKIESTTAHEYTSIEEQTITSINSESDEVIDVTKSQTTITDKPETPEQEKEYNSHEPEPTKSEDLPTEGITEIATERLTYTPHGTVTESDINKPVTETINKLTITDEVTEITTKESYILVTEEQEVTKLPQVTETKLNENEKEEVYTSTPDTQGIKFDDVTYQSVTESHVIITKDPMLASEYAETSTAHDVSVTDKYKESSIIDKDLTSHPAHDISDDHQKHTEAPESYSTTSIEDKITKQPEIYATLADEYVTTEKSTGKPYETPDSETYEKDVPDQVHYTTLEDIIKLTTTGSSKVVTDKTIIPVTEPQKQPSTDQKLDSLPHLITTIEPEIFTDSIDVATEVSEIHSEKPVLIEENQQDLTTKIPDQDIATDTSKETIVDNLTTQSTYKDELSTEQHQTISHEITKAVTDFVTETSSKSSEVDEKEAQNEQSTTRAQTTQISDKSESESTISFTSTPEFEVVTEREPDTFTVKEGEKETPTGTKKEGSEPFISDEKHYDTTEDSIPSISDEKLIESTAEDSGSHVPHLPEITATDSVTGQTASQVPLEIVTETTSAINVEDTDKNILDASEKSTKAPESFTTFEHSPLDIKDRVTTEPQISYTSSGDQISTTDNIGIQKEHEPDNDSFLTTLSSLQLEDNKKATEIPMSLVTHIDHAPSQTTPTDKSEITEQVSVSTEKQKLEDEKTQTMLPEIYVTEAQKPLTEIPNILITQKELETETTSQRNIEDSINLSTDQAEKATKDMTEDEHSVDSKTTPTSSQKLDTSTHLPSTETVSNEYTQGTPTLETEKTITDSQSQKTTTIPLIEKEPDLSHEKETSITESVDEVVTKTSHETQTVLEDITTTTSSILRDDEHVKESISTTSEQQGTELPETNVHDTHTILPENVTTVTEEISGTKVPEISAVEESDTSINIPTVTELTEKPVSIVTEINVAKITEKDYKPTDVETSTDEPTTYVNIEEVTDNGIVYTHGRPLSETTEAQYTVTQQKESSTETSDRATKVPDLLNTSTENLLTKLPEQDEHHENTDTSDSGDISLQSSTKIPEISTSITETQTEQSGIEKVTFVEEKPAEEDTSRPTETVKDPEVQPEIHITEATIEKGSSTTADLSMETDKKVIDVHTPTEISPTTLESSRTETQSTQTHKEFDVSEEQKQTTGSGHEFSETTPFLVELKEHTHQVNDESTLTSTEDIFTTGLYEPHHTERGDQNLDITDKYEYQTPTPVEVTKQEHTDKLLTTPDQVQNEYQTPTPVEVTKQEHTDKLLTTPNQEQTEQKVPTTTPTISDVTERLDSTGTTTSPKYSESDLLEQEKQYTTAAEEVVLTTSSAPVTVSERETYTTISSDILKLTYPTPETSGPSTEKSDNLGTDGPLLSSTETSSSNEDLTKETSKATSKISEESTTLLPLTDKSIEPEEKPIMTTPSPPTQELTKPVFDDEINGGIPPPDFPPSGTGGYGQEPDYVEEDQAFGPGTCRYGGKVYVSAQQIPRDDPCDFCFCFRSDIICLQQSCPPPIHGCHEEPIQGFCCPRYECPVSMATTMNVTTTTTTTTTTLPPHFLPHAYKGAAQRRGCQIKGHTYKVGEVVRASSGPCLHCTCGGDGQMKCDPKACTPEPMLRQMIAAAVSAKRRR